MKRVREVAPDSSTFNSLIIYASACDTLGCMTIFFRYTLAKKKEKHPYHNLATKETVNVIYSHMGYETADMFTGIDSVTTLDNKPITSENTTVYSAFSYTSQWCNLFPMITFLSLIAAVVIFYINFTHNNMYIAFGIFGLFFLFYIGLILTNKYFEGLYLTFIPKKKGWIRAYIDDFGDLSYPDEKSGKVVKSAHEVDGKTRISWMTKEEANSAYNAFINKDKSSDKKFF